MDGGLVKRIVLTGGPCGGKSTVQTILSDIFQNLGWKVFRVPETATVLLSGGVSFAELSEEQAFHFQLDLLRVMLRIEETYFNLAKSEAAQNGRKCLVICDRGAMDASAYIDRAAWQKILKEVGQSDVELRDERYDIVVHLVTAALGAEEFYSSESNSARSEGFDLARHLDQLCQNAWIGHPYFDIIDNSTSFEQKCHRVVSALLARMGLEDKRYGKNVSKFKFLVSSEYNLTETFQVSHQDFRVEHRYLPQQPDGSQTRIRRRSQNGTSHFNMTVRKPSMAHKSGGPVHSWVEVRRSLTGREYDALYQQSDPNHDPIIKKRRCFLWNNRYYQLDRFERPHGGLMILEAYFSKEDLEAAGGNWRQMVPPFVPVQEDITSSPEYSMRQLSRRDKK